MNILLRVATELVKMIRGVDDRGEASARSTTFLTPRMLGSKDARATLKFTGHALRM